MNSFQEAGLKPEILKAVEELGFVSPMPVQAKVIPILLEKDTDMIALAQTGTGKTAAFGLPILQKCSDNKITEALILSPTRELCMQIAKDMEAFSKYMPGVKIVAVYGGASIERQLSELSRGVKIIVATPGRMLDIIRRKKVDLSHLKVLVLDEADEMLNMGFKEELDGILATTPEEKNTWFFSATMPKEIKNITQKYLSNQEEVTVGNRNEGSANVSHHYYMVQAKHRYLALKRIIDVYPDIYSIIFCRTRRETQEVAEALIKDGYNADALHGDLSQAQRDNAMSRFRLKNLQLLVATDVAARGLDVNNLTHVLNYNLPDDIEQYTHRSGRTGRAGKTGISISVITQKDRSKIKEIERQIRKDFELKKLPTGEEVCEKQLFHVVERMENVDLSMSEEIDAYLPEIHEKLQHLSKEDLIKRFVAVEFNRFIEYYQNAPQIDEVDESREKQRRGDGGSFARLFINIGRIDGVKPQNLIGLLNDYVKERDMRIGHIEILKTFSFVEIDASFQDVAVAALKRAVYQDRRVFAEISKEQPKRSRSEGDRGGYGGGRRRNEDDGYGARRSDRSSGRSYSGRPSSGRSSSSRSSSSGKSRGDRNRY